MEDFDSEILEAIFGAGMDKAGNETFSPMIGSGQLSGLTKV
jgi:hypothetical protein